MAASPTPSTTGPVSPPSTTAPAAPSMQPCDPEVTATAEPSDPSPTAFSTSPAPCSKAAPHSNQPSPSKMTLDNGWGVLPRMTGEEEGSVHRRQDAAQAV